MSARAEEASAERAGRWLERSLDLLGLPHDAVRLRFNEGEAIAGRAEPGLITLGGGLRHAGWRRQDDIGPLILAHEAAHLAQFRLTGLSAPKCELEAEADAAAQALVAGRAFRCRLAAAPQVLHWNRAGHYYTVYYVALAAGANEVEAQRMALCCQTPDLVSEFDAPTQTAVRNVIDDQTGATISSILLLTNQFTSDPGVIPEDYETCNDVIEGLHALTGASIQDERRRRVQNLGRADWNSLDFGIGLHALGDAWAHCKNGRMYGHDFGHAFDGHEPDSVHDHVDSYIDYARTLYDIVNSKTALPPRLPRDFALNALRIIFAQLPDDAEEARQIPALRALIDPLCQQKALVHYTPPNTCIAWATFRGQAGGRSFDADAFGRIMQLARSWRVTRRDERTAVQKRADAAQRRAMESAMPY